MFIASTLSFGFATGVDLPPLHLIFLLSERILSSCFVRDTDGLKATHDMNPDDLDPFQSAESCLTLLFETVNVMGIARAFLLVSCA